ncbi:STAS domain-containing protein [Streptomyces liliiviolaceus]|uniref:STAS domain-containing protein n=1 Tax=Streptomyces liliiviolaceus TaxID=2823109 RepID=UPI001FFD41A4|nr:STAS domain-containing protein [Streptomyces liliiviolaceus]
MNPSHPVQPGRWSASSTSIDGIHVVTLRGELDYTARERAEKVLTLPVGDAPLRTVADLSGVTFMNSTGINALVSAHQAAAATDGWVRVAGAQAPVLRVMELVGLDTVIACYLTVDQALER